MGTCRIYLAPKFDERGLPWLFRDQKNMFVELDRFTVTRKYDRISKRNHCFKLNLVLSKDHNVLSYDLLAEKLF